MHYLGVPLFYGSPRASYFTNIVSNILKQLSSWKVKSLSMVGRICLVQAVATPKLVYSFMTYSWPKSSIKHIVSAFRNFVWSGCVTERKIVMASWTKCCSAFQEGGLGIKNL